MEDKRNSNKRQVLSQNRLVEASLPPRLSPRKTQQKYKRKNNLFASRKRQLHIANVIPIWGSSDREEGASTPYAQGHIEGETASSKPHYLPANVRETDQYGSRSLKLSKGIILDGRTDIHVFDRGSRI
ncbi:hypothetical protein AVEN_85604-1 [Araneus ventricosus]|uniref:Uncharacterized protein n=1 Tax=Araneus ventricosus TaxID=182803 RepID=A0A4Y2PTW1_ARAVE|nr:hypothetical protein AVEN_85604-1 [Araneus ventricosus]